MRVRMLLALFLLLEFCVARCEGSRPVLRKAPGCVIGGQVYVLDDAGGTYRYTLTRPVDLRPYEGKVVVLDGWLLPGDRFTPRQATFKVLRYATLAERNRVAQYRSIWDGSYQH
jgi:hypothetical protein